MLKYLGIIILPLLLLCIPAGAQSLTIKPYIGYGTVKMDDANNDMILRINQLRETYQQFIPAPELLNGSLAWGIEATYRIEDDYFLNIRSFYSSERTAKDYSSPTSSSPFDFHFDREIKFLDLAIGVQYYFSYSSWKPVNFYFQAGAGLGIGWSTSNFYSRDNDPVTYDPDSRGDFSGSALTAHLAAGTTIRILPAVFLGIEGGYRFANLRQLDGTIIIQGKKDTNYTTQSFYDFSGFFISVGTGFIIPLFN